MYIVEVYGANFEPSSPHNLVVYGYIVHMYVYLDRLFSWSSNTLVKLSMPAWPTFMWVMNDSKPIFQSEIKMLSQHGYNMAAWLWKNIRNADRGLIDRGAIHKRCLQFFQIFWPTPAHVGKFQEIWPRQPPLSLPTVVMLQVSNCEIVVNFCHISHNLTWYSAIVHKFTRIYPVCSTYELTKQFM